MYPDWKNRSILIADDDLSSHLLLGEILKPTGIKIYPAYDGTEAFSAFIENPGIQVIIMDIRIEDSEPAYAELEEGITNVPINIKEAETQMMVTSGDTVVIGGIIQESSSLNDHRVPGLGDIPGLGWLAQFYLTHFIHYLGAILLLGLLAFFIVDYLLLGRKEFRLTSSAYVRMVLMAGIVFTGIIRVLKNLPDVVFSPGFTLFIDISHLGLIMVYLLTALVFLIMKSSWVVRK